MMKMPASEIARIARFGLVGIGATLVHLVFAQLALLITGAAMPSTIIGFVPAFVFSYLGHRHVTFGDAERGSVLRFFAVALTGLGVSLLVLTRLDAIHPWIAVTISVGVIPAWTYIMSRLWVFTNPR